MPSNRWSSPPRDDPRGHNWGYQPQQQPQGYGSPGGHNQQQQQQVYDDAHEDSNNTNYSQRQQRGASHNNTVGPDRRHDTYTSSGGGSNQERLLQELLGLVQQMSQKLDQQSHQISELSALVRVTQGRSPSPSGKHIAASGLRVDPNVRFCHLCDVTYNEQITLEHVEGKRHKQHLLRLLHAQDWEELSKQRDIAKRANAQTPESLYGPESMHHDHRRQGQQGHSSNNWAQGHQQPQHVNYNHQQQPQQGRSPSPARVPIFNPSFHQQR